MKSNLRIFWIVVDDDGGFKSWTLESTRAYAIRVLLTDPFTDLKGKTWKQLYRAGWRVRRVRLEPVGCNFNQ